MNKKRTRNETTFRKTLSKDGTFSPHLNKAVSARIISYCEMTGMNKTQFVGKCVNEWLDVFGAKYIEELPKEDLADIVKKACGFRQKDGDTQ